MELEDEKKIRLHHALNSVKALEKDVKRVNDRLEKIIQMIELALANEKRITVETTTHKPCGPEYRPFRGQYGTRFDLHNQVRP
jgi:hypothetical protein